MFKSSYAYLKLAISEVEVLSYTVQKVEIFFSELEKKQ